MNTMKLQTLWPDLRSDVVRMALRAIPSDVAVCMPEEMLVATVRSIASALRDVANQPKPLS